MHDISESGNGSDLSVSGCQCCNRNQSDIWMEIICRRYAAIILLYFVINHVLVGKIRKITPAEILKNRE